MSTEYKPISCGLFDSLESMAVVKKRITVVFMNEKEERTETVGTIIDLFSKDKIEYLKMNNGVTIRLDNLLEVDGTAYGTFC